MECPIYQNILSFFKHVVIFCDKQSKLEENQSFLCVESTHQSFLCVESRFVVCRIYSRSCYDSPQ